MSGGHFDYIQHRVSDAVDEIVRVLKFEDGRGFSNDACVALQQTARVLSVASQLLHDADRFISDDTGEDTFVPVANSSMRDLFNIVQYSDGVSSWTPQELSTDLAKWQLYEQSVEDSSFYHDPDEQIP